MTGLWHGASWSYVIWGGCFGLLIVGETLIAHFRGGREKRPGLLRSLPRRLAVFAVSALIFVWFRFPVLSSALRQFGSMFGTAGFWNAGTAYLLRGGAVVLAVSLVGATPLPKMLCRRLEQTRAGEKILPAARMIWMALILGLCTAYLVDGSFSPFLYFRF